MTLGGVSMLFGKYLKKYRIESGLTQTQTAAKLNLVGGDLSNIDAVTFSRWERGTTNPTIARSIRVLRELTNDLEGYLSELSHEQKSLKAIQERVNHFDLIMDKKYNSLNAMVNRADYKTSPVQSHNLICECPICHPSDQSVIDDILRFHTQTSAESVKHGLMYINLIEYQSANKVNAYKYIDSITHELLGHNIGVLFSHEAFESEINSLKEKTIDEIDLRKAASYNPKKKFVYYAVSQHSLYERPFRLQLHREFKYLARRANITDYYATVAVKSSVTLLEKMGFTLVAYEEKSPVGAIKIGKSTYSRAIMHIDTSQLFAQPEFLNLLTNCETCINPCYKHSDKC